MLRATFAAEQKARAVRPEPTFRRGRVLQVVRPGQRPRHRAAADWSAVLVSRCVPRPIGGDILRSSASEHLSRVRRRCVEQRTCRRFCSRACSNPYRWSARTSARPQPRRQVGRTAAGRVRERTARLGGLARSLPGLGHPSATCPGVRVRSGSSRLVMVIRLTDPRALPRFRCTGALAATQRPALVASAPIAPSQAARCVPVIPGAP